jgi:hypothetical protein
MDSLTFIKLNPINDVILIKNEIYRNIVVFLEIYISSNGDHTNINPSIKNIILVAIAVLPGRSSIKRVYKTKHFKTIPSPFIKVAI